MKQNEKVNEWTRQTALDGAYEEMHGIKPEVYLNRINQNIYKIKLIFGGKEIIITHELERNLSKNITLEYNGNKTNYKTHLDAELGANIILRG